MNYKNVDSFIWIQDLSLPFFGDRNIQSKRNLGIVIMIIIMPLVLLVKMILTMMMRRMMIMRVLLSTCTVPPLKKTLLAAIRTSG